MSRRIGMRMAAALVVSAGAVLVSGPASQAAKIVVVPDLTAPLGSNGVVTDVMLANVMARHGYPVSVAAQETPGYMYNIRYMDKTYSQKSTGVTMFGVDDWLLAVGPEGGKGALKESLPQPITHHFKLLFAHIADSAGRMFVTFDPKIKTMADVKGKTLDIGLPTQSDWGLSARLLLDAYGITSANTKIHEVSPPVMTAQLIAGTVDVAVASTQGNAVSNKFVPGAQLVKMFAAAKASGKTLHFISISPAVITKINKEYGTVFYPVTLPAHALGPEQTEAFTSGVSRAYHAVTTNFPPKIAYEVTKAVLKYGPELKKEGGVWTYWSPQLMVSGLAACNTNPGAIKAYKEAHVWKDRKTAGPTVIIPPCKGSAAN